MPQRPPAHDETVRMRPDDVDGRPTPASSPPVPDEESDNTRPMTRDWLLGAPESGRPAASDALPQQPEAAPNDRVAPAQFDDTTPVQQVIASESISEPAAGPAETAQEPAEVPGVATAVQDTGPPSGPPPADGPPEPAAPGAWWRRRAVLIPAGAVVVLAAAYGADLLISTGDIPRNTVVAGVDIGGLSTSAATDELTASLAPRVAAEHQIRADDVTGLFSPVTAGITLDVEATLDRADDQPLNPWTRLVTLFADRAVEPVFTGEETELTARMGVIAEQVDRAPVDATIVVEGTTPRVAEPADGRELDREGAAEAIIAALASGADPAETIDLPVDVLPVRVDAETAARVLEETVRPALSAPVTVVGTEGATSAEVPVAAIAAALTFTATDDGDLVTAVDPVALQTALGDELSVFGTPAKDATYQLSGGAVSVVPSVDGTGVSPAVLAEQLVPVFTEPAPRTVTAQLGPVPADFTTEEAEALGIREEIGSFTTKIGNAASGTNIRVVAQEVDGAVVLPGEAFSLNGFTGPRGLAQGYVEAGVINRGQFTTAVGGGISQFATTMFNAVFFAGLEDVFHKPHSYYISRYPAGREATVYYDSIDLTWRNDSDTGVYIDTAWTPGSLTVTFYGTKRYEIQSISSERYNQRAPVEQEKPNDGTCKAQGGSTGFNITVTRVFRDLGTGAEVKRENFQTRYAAEPIIRCAPAAPAPTDGAAPVPGG